MAQPVRSTRVADLDDIDRRMMEEDDTLENIPSEKEKLWDYIAVLKRLVFEPEFSGPLNFTFSDFKTYTSDENVSLLKKLIDGILTYKRTVQETKTENAALKASYEQQLADLVSQHQAALGATIQELTTAKEELTKARAETQTLAKHSTEDKNKLAEMLSSVQADLKKKTEFIVSMQAQLSDATEKLRGEERKVTAMDKVLQNEKEKLRQKTTAVADCERKIAELEQQLRALNARDTENNRKLTEVTSARTREKEAMAADFESQKKRLVQEHTKEKEEAVKRVTAEKDQAVKLVTAQKEEAVKRLAAEKDLALKAAQDKLNASDGALATAMSNMEQLKSTATKDLANVKRDYEARLSVKDGELGKVRQELAQNKTKKDDTQVLRLQHDVQQRQHMIAELERKLADQRNAFQTQIGSDLDFARRNRVSLKDFILEDLMLFFPSSSGYYAFNDGAPHFYLDVDISEQLPAPKPWYVLGNVVSIESHEASSTYNPYNLPIGTTFNSVTITLYEHKRLDFRMDRL